MLGWLVILLITLLIVGGFAGLALWLGNRMAAEDDQRTEMLREQYREQRLRNPYAHNCGAHVAPAEMPAASATPPPPVPSNAPLRAELIDDVDKDLPEDERARRAWPMFLQMWEAHRRDSTHRFLIRTSLHGRDAVESCWLRPTTIDGPQYIVIAAVAQDPVKLRSVRKGEKVRVRLGADLQKLEDWKIETPTGLETPAGTRDALE
ncbi:MAG: hypothetical protein AAGD32_16265 [Planctomycetota bacterium]